MYEQITDQESIEQLIPFLTPQEIEEMDILLSFPDRTLREFVRAAWHVLEPQKVFVDNWHIGAICEHLQAMTEGQLFRLIINMPPRSMKSLLASVMWFVWTWTVDPSSRWLTGSYAAGLAIRDAVKSRDLINSNWFRREYSGLFTFAADQNVKNNYKNNCGGQRIAFGFDGTITGEGGEYITADDPHKTQEAESQTIRETTVRTWNETLSTRGNDAATTRFLVTMQRQHEHDLTGELLKDKLGYEHLMLPMRYEENGSKSKYITCLGFSDPRTKEGESLDEIRFGPTELLILEKQLGSYGTAAQLQQRPIPRGGGLFDVTKLQECKALPNNCTLAVGWDKGFTQSGGAYTAGLVMARCDDTPEEPNFGNWYILHVTRGQWESNLRDEAMLAAAERYKTKYTRVRHIFEQEPGSTGRDSVILLKKKFVGYTVKSVAVSGDKYIRAEEFASQWNAGNVFVVRESEEDNQWIDELKQEYGKFSATSSGYKDQIDAGSLVFNDLAIFKRKFGVR